MATKELKRAKAHKLLRNHDPVLDADNYNESLLRVINYFNVTYDAKERMGWIKAHYPKVKFKDASDLDFKVLSNLVRLVDNGNELSEKHLILMDNEVARLTDRSKQIKDASLIKCAPLTTTKLTIQEKMDEKVSEFLGEFAGLVDDYVSNKNIGNVEKLINQMGIRGPMVKKVLVRIEANMAELNAALLGKDKDLVEGYSQFKKTELKKLIGIYDSLVAALGQAKVMTVRKTRAVKVKPPAVVAKSVKYQVENKDLKMKSINPATVVGASELWVFNTKYRKLQHYEASVGMTLTFKGTTIQNFDVTKSKGKTIRKPEGVLSLDGKRAYNKFYKETKATEQNLTGRINEDCILLVAFK